MRLVPGAPGTDRSSGDPAAVPEGRRATAALMAVVFLARSMRLVPHAGDLDLRLTWWHQPSASPYAPLGPAVLAIAAFRGFDGGDGDGGLPGQRGTPGTEAAGDAAAGTRAEG
ncbi:hypothetical protein [Streptomyces marianii]|uniref:Uncharacterized protein n=1 Tax=Streptomyces marianii TaxID=1817406 RepID=A0A5R9E5D9_9ACTN|nr:hypothetical protein [Streptomyces marianii]TLQ45220.1 hypothetical protein FEF34_21220 [Streptomyces marianii]